MDANGVLSRAFDEATQSLKTSGVAGGAETVDVTKVGGTAVDTNSGTKSAGTQRVVIATDQPALTNGLLVNLEPKTSGGLSVYRNLDAGTTGAVAKASAGQLYGYFISNNAATARFVKVYDKASAPTQADTPVMTLQLPASSAANVSHPNGVAFSAGISIRASTGVADNDTGATTTNDVIVNLYYK